MYFNFKAKEPRIEDHMQLFGITGSYLKTYIKGVTTYSEKAMYQPNSLGCLKVIVRPFDMAMRLERFVIWRGGYGVFGYTANIYAVVNYGIVVSAVHVHLDTPMTDKEIFYWVERCFWFEKWKQSLEDMFVDSYDL